jgi:hypothetical protein
MDFISLRPGDKVRVLADLFDPQSTLLTVTAGSVGSIISFHEYREYIENTFGGKDTLADRERHFSQVAKDLQEDRAFLVKVESFAPAPDTVGPGLLEDTVVVPAQYLEEL